jgi:hypothetical protein
LKTSLYGKISCLKSAGRWFVSIAILTGGGIAFCAQLPYVKTQMAGPVRATTATLNGMAVPRTNATTAWFEWGTDRTYGNTTAPQDIGNGVRVVRVSQAISNLVEGAVYHFRLVASNSVGVVPGFDFMFTTGMKVQNWGGSFANGFPLVPAGLTNLSGIACGHRVGLAIRNDGSVAAWTIGTPDSGQANIPPGLSNVVAVAGGYSHCMALKEDGTVAVWGKDPGGYVFDPPSNLTNVIAISAGDNFSTALKADGTVVAWSKDGPPGVTNVPVNLSNVVAISSGGWQTTALKADGTLTVWGFNPTFPPSTATNIVAISTFQYNWSVALRGDGTVLNTGLNYSLDVPQPANLTNIVAIAAGDGLMQALKANGTLVGWGDSGEVTNIPPGLSNVVALASGDNFSVGLAPVNLGPKARARSLSGAMNKPLTISVVPLGVFDPNGDQLSLQVTSLPNNGVLYQYTDNGPGVAITSPGTMLTDASRVIFVPQTDVYATPYDSFSVSGTDGEFSSAAAPFTISIVPEPIIQSASFTSGPPAKFVLEFTGPTNVNYSVYRTDSRGCLL